jgi:hypothetical protein
LAVARVEQEQAAKQALADAEQRAAYDALELARVEQKQTAKHALADRVHKLASDVMALAGVAEWGKRIRHS